MATEPGDATYSLRQLAVEGRVTPRTVHFYIQQGLLPSAGTLGSQARYGTGHLARLRLIQRLQKEHLPLAEIAGRIRSRASWAAAPGCPVMVREGRPRPTWDSTVTGCPRTPTTLTPVTLPYTLGRP